jgi:hypothetical protein
MPFDPTLPAQGTPLESQVMRDQFNSLKALIDAVQTLTAAQIDATDTLAPGSAATVSVSVTGNTLHFTFGIPADAPGEVSQSDLNTAYNDLLASSSANANEVNTLDNPYADSDAEELRQKVNELLNAMRR